MGGDDKRENCCSNLRERNASILTLLWKEQPFSYVTDLLDRRLSGAHWADVCSPFDNPGNVEERANALNEVAYEEGKEEYCDVGANKKLLVGRAATPHH